MTVQFAIFDFDGTLADSLPWFLGKFDQMADFYDFRKLDRGVLDELRHCSAQQLLLHYSVPTWKLPYITHHLRLLMRRDIAAIKPVPGIQAALRKLAEEGVVLGILTSNSRQNVIRVLGPRTADLFRYWECDASVFGKTVQLSRLLLTSRYSSHEAIFVGDEIGDAQVAREARVPFGAVAWGFTHLQSLAAENVAETFSDPAELVTKLIRGSRGNGQ
jgi:phosphoglycolate phosphatase